MFVSPKVFAISYSIDMFNSFLQGNNSVFTFALATTSPTVPFVIDANTGVISVSSTLDYETTQQYFFMVCAQLYIGAELGTFECYGCIASIVALLL